MELEKNDKIQYIRILENILKGNKLYVCKQLVDESAHSWRNITNTSCHHLNLDMNWGRECGKGCEIDGGTLIEWYIHSDR